MTATSVNVQCDEIGEPGPPNWPSPLPAHRHSDRAGSICLTHTCLFVLLGPDSDPIMWAAISLRLNSNRPMFVWTVEWCQPVATVRADSELQPSVTRSLLAGIA